MVVRLNALQRCMWWFMLSDLAFVGLVCYGEFDLWLVSLDGARGRVVVWFCWLL